MIYLCYGDYHGRTLKAFINYVIARAEQDSRELSYKAYVTDLLQGLAMRNGLDVSKRWYDLINGNGHKNEAEEALNNFFSDMRR